MMAAIPNKKISKRSVSAGFVRAYLLIQMSAGLCAFLRLSEKVRGRFFTDAAGARFVDDPAKIIHRQFRV
jgi:hypothetical protein